MSEAHDPYDDIEYYYAHRLPPPDAEREFPVQCASCNMDSNERPQIRMRVFKDRAFDKDRYEWLCDVCAGTWVSNSVWYPSVQRDAETQKIIAQVTNMILARIEQPPTINAFLQHERPGTWFGKFIFRILGL